MPVVSLSLSSYCEFRSQHFRPDAIKRRRKGVIKFQRNAIVLMAFILLRNMMVIDNMEMKMAMGDDVMIRQMCW